MGFFDRFRRKPKTLDPIAAYEARIDALAQRAQLVRKSAATLLALRNDLERRIEELEAKERDARARADGARLAGDAEAAQILEKDAGRLARDKEPLLENRARVATDAQDLADAATALNAEREALTRERDSAKLALAAGQAVLETRPALTERFNEVARLDAARDEVERAHALAEIHREDALRARGRDRV